MEDKRFTHLKTDPKFRRIPKGAEKVKIDKRFQSMFKEKQFKVKYTVDKRGRPVNQTSTEDLKRYYDLSSDSESESDKEPSKSGKIVEAPVSDDLESKHKSDKAIPDEIKKKLRNLHVDYARGESSLLSESSSDDEESDEEISESEAIEHNWGELDNDADSTEDMTYRLAACNMDWDRIRAIDLMVLFNSFLPPGGAVKSVTIYPSEFGKARLKEEEVKGPTELVDGKLKDEEETEEGSKYHMEKLRQYQLNRLKYYYTVIVFDSANTANKIYTECDGMEYESSSTKLDLRFIPDDMTFDDNPKDQCDKLPELNKYQPRFFTTTALQQAKVDLTWDETDPDRIEMTQKLNSGKIEDLSQKDLQNYVAVSEEESEAEEEEDDDDEDNTKNPIDKYKQLLQEIESKEEEKKNRDVQMEVSWGIDLKSKTEKMVKKKMAEDEEKTPFQKYLDKRKEKRKEKKKQRKGDESDSDDMPSDIDMNDPYFAEEFDNPEFKKKKEKKRNEKNVVEENNEELELLLNEDDGKSHFNLKKIQKQEEATTKKKRKRKEAEEKQDDFEINVQDERFSALYTSHLYNIDPTSPHYKKTKGMETLISEKLTRRQEENVVEEKRTVRKDPGISLLVKSIKRNTAASIKKKK